MEKPVVRRVRARVSPAALAMLGLLLGGAAIVAVVRLIPGVSPLLIAILVGAVLGNARALPARMSFPIAAGSKRLLRSGIVVLGLTLSVGNLLEIGWRGISVLLITTAVTFGATVLLGRVLGVSRLTGLLVATGFSICGASAVAAMSSVLDPEEESSEDAARALALVTIFGTVALFLLPPLARTLGLTDVQAGVWIGSSVHEVGQVVAAGGMVSAAALAVATITKLGRVVLLAPLIAVVSLSTRGPRADARRRPPIIPLFVAGFLVAIAVRSIVEFPPLADLAVKTTSEVLLAAAMLGLGYAVNLRSVAASGWRPVILGALSTTVAVVTSLIGIQMFAV